MSNHPIKKIVILGGGTAGWTAAAMLSSHFKKHVCRIQVVESSALGTVGVGESTIPPFVRLIQNLGIDEQDFIQKTGACYKLGIKFVDWHKKGESFFHPFGAIGKRIETHDFYQCWNRANREGNDFSLLDFSPNAVMAAEGRFFPPHQFPDSAIGGANYAVHLDATQVAAYLRDFALEKGVQHTEGKVEKVEQRPDGFISRLQLASGDYVEGDFYIDCSGFRALMIGDALKSPLEDWSDYLPCDHAIVAKTEHKDEIKPFTTATARKAGWSWRIPLRDRVGCGYVYSSRFCTDAEAKSTLMRTLNGPLASEPRVIAFKSGMRREIWKNNCLALGLSSGFVEPLESTAIHLIARGLDFFLRFFPDSDCDPALRREYNRRMAMDYEEVRDFIVLHYCATEREDTPFWRWCKAMPIPETLHERIELFKGHGVVREGVDELFRNSSWQSLFEGMGIRPEKYCPRVDNLDSDRLKEHLRRAKKAILATVSDLPTHDEYLARIKGTSGTDG